MKLCGSVSWCKIGWLVVLLNLLFSPIFSYSQNLPPVPDRGIPNQHAEVGSVFSYLIPADAFIDENGDQLIYKIINTDLPAGLHYDEPTHTISGNPTTTGVYVVPVRISDGATSVNARFKIIVHPKNTSYAAFTVDYQRGCNYKLVQFTNHSKNMSSFAWTLGNGNTTTNIANPAAIYNKPGTYSVSLKINGGSSPELIYTDTITIYPKPKPIIADNVANGCAPLSAILTSAGTPVTIPDTTINSQHIGEVSGGTDQYFYWYFFEKHDAVFTTTPSTNIDSFTYGNYRVNLEVSDENGCQGSAYVNDLFKVYDRPVASFTYDKANNCEPSLTTFYDESSISGSSITNYTWTVNGNTLANNDTVRYNFATPGTGDYEATLQTTSEFGCSSAIYKETVRFNDQNSADFSTDSLYCIGDTVSLSALVSAGAVSYAWDIENNGSTESTSPDYNFTYTTTGIKNIKLRVGFNDDCSKEAIKPVYIDQLNANFGFSYTYLCTSSFEVSFSDSSYSELGNPIKARSWYWVKPGGNELLSNSSDFQHTFTNEGTYEILLEVENTNGCSSSITKSVTLQYPQLSINLSGITSGCLPVAGPTNFEAVFDSPSETPQSYKWDFGDGTFGTGQSTTHTYTAPGNFVAKATVKTATCTYTTQINAAAFANPPTISTVNLIQPDQCYSSGIQLDVHYSAGTDEILFDTQSGRETQTTLASSPYAYDYFPTDTGLFDITVTISDNGCMSAPHIVNNIHTNEPLAYFSPDQTSFCGDSAYKISFDNQSKYSDPGTTFQWDFGDGIGTSTELSPNYEYATTGNYKVTLKAKNPTNGCEDIYTDSIFIYSYTDTPGIITSNTSTGCAPLSVLFSQTIASSISANFNPSEFEWDYNNDGVTDTVTSLPDIEHTFDQPGVYSIRLVARNNSTCEYEFTELNMIDVHGPIADFDYAPLNNCINELVSFTNKTWKSLADPADSTKNSYEWNFGDGTSTSSIHPNIHTNHTYTDSGSYSVSLYVTDENSCHDTLTKENIIDILPFEASYTITDTIVCDPTPITFSNTSMGNIVEYRWNFGDGTPDSTANSFNNFSYTYTSPGVYTPTLEAESVDGCVQSYTKTIRFVNVTADFTTTPTEIGCAPAFAYFEPLANANEVEGYLWTFGDGNTSKDRSPRNYYVQPGHYLVSLTINFIGNCTKTSGLSVTVDGAYGYFDYDNTPRCSPNTINFSVADMSNVSFITWDFGTGTIASDVHTAGTTRIDRTFDYTSLGYATPKVILTDSVCGEYSYDNTVKGSIYTSVAPKVGFWTDADSVCKGVPIQFNDTTVSSDPVYGLDTWTWNFGNSTNASSNEKKPIFAYRETGTFSPQLIVTNELGCSDTLTKSNSIDIFTNADLSADFIIDDLLACPNQELEFTSKADAGSLHSVDKYEWDFGSGYNTGNTFENHSYDTTYRGQTITVWHKITDDQFCTDSTFRTVDINNLQAGFGYVPQHVTRGSLVDFKDTSQTDFNTNITTWSWTFQDAQPGTSTESSPKDVSFLNIQKDLVTLTVTNDNGCEASATALINVQNNLPTLESFSITMIENTSFTFFITNFYDSINTLNSNFKPNDEGQKLFMLQIVQTPSHGKLFFKNVQIDGGTSIAASDIGLLVFKPDANWSGNTSFSWNGNDGTDWANQPSQVFITVIPEPDPPTLADTSYSVPEDSVITITRDTLLKYFSSFDNSTFDSLTITNISAGAGVLTFKGNAITTNSFLIRGTEINNSDAVLVFTPSPGYNGTFSFNWNAKDLYNFATSPATLSIYYYNTRPFASDIVFDPIPQGTAITIPKDTFLTHYYDPDRYDRPSSFNLGNLPPSSVGTFYFNGKAISGSSYWIPNFYDSIVSIRFVPINTYEGKFSINWILSDGSSNDQAQIWFNYINTAPIISLINVQGIEDNPLVFQLINFDNNNNAIFPFKDIDPGDELQQISINTLPKRGELKLAGNTVSIGTTISRAQINQHELVYLPYADLNGIDQFKYNASDGSEWANQDATVYINVKAVNDAPRPVDHNLTIAEDHILNNVSLAGDYDIDDEQNVLTYLIANTDSATAGEHGTIQLDKLGNLIFTPEKDYFNTVYFNYTVCDDDDDMACDTGRVTIEIRPINDPPVAVNDTFSIYENDLPTSYNCLANDSDIDSPNLYLFSIDSSFITPASSDYGKLAWSTDGILTFTLNIDLDSLYEDEPINVKFDYLVEDDSLATTPGIITILIIGQNDRPLAKRDTFNFNEGFDSIYSGDNYATITFNDEEIDGDDIFISLMNNDTVSPIEYKYGWFYWNTDGKWSFKENSAVTDSLKKGEVQSFGYPYQISDGSLESQPDSVIFEITGINDAPFAINDTLVITEDVPDTTINTNNTSALLYNDTDIDGDSFRVVQIDDDSTGLIETEVGFLQWRKDGSYTFFVKTDTTNHLGVNDSALAIFTYTIIDDYNASDSAQLVIIIKGTNDPPSANPYFIRIYEDSLLTKVNAKEGLLKYAGDTDNDIIIVDVNSDSTNTTIGQYGTLKWDSTGAFSYNMVKEKVDPLYLGYTRTDKFTYYVKDPSGDTASSYLMIIILGQNDAPFANDTLFSMTEDESPLIKTTSNDGILANNYDIDAIEIKDSFGIISVNNLPDPIINGHYGFLHWEYNGTFSYTLNDSIDSLAYNEVVRDTFNYVIEDKNKATAQALFIIKINGENDLPTAVVDTLDITEDTLNFTPSITLLNNDFDIDGDTIQLYSLNNETSSPTLTRFALIEWTKTGRYTYYRNQHNDKSMGLDTLAWNDFVIDSIPYSIIDKNNGTASSYLRLGIQGMDDAPVARRDSNSIFQNEYFILGSDSTSLLANDFDVDRHDTISVFQVKGDTGRYTDGLYGKLTWDTTGTYRYDWWPKNDSLAEDEMVFDLFPYTIIDVRDSMATDTLIITLIGKNDVPYARNDTITIYEDDGSKELTGTDAILYNDEDIDREPVHLFLNNQSEVSYTGTYGTLTLFENGDGRYDLNLKLDTLYEGEEVIDTFSYTIADNLGADSTATIYMIIIGENDAPDAIDDLGPIITEDTPSISSTDSLLANDSDIDNDLIYIQSINASIGPASTGEYGTLKWDSLGNYTYLTDHNITNHLAMGDTVTDIFTYVLSDIFGGTDTARLSITITGENDPLIANNDTTQIDEDGYCKYDVVANDDDPEGNFDYSSLKIVQGTHHGKASINSSNGIIYYFPNKDFYGSDSLRYKICDTGDPVYCDSAWFFIEVKSVNDPPIATNLILTTPVNIPVSFNALDQVYDIDDGIDPGSLQWPSEQGITNSGDMLVYTPPTDFIGVDEFIYSAADFAGERAYVIVNIIIQDEGFGAQNDTASTNENTLVSVSILKNDTLTNFLPDPLSVDIKVFPIHGTASYSISKQVIDYMPNENFNGTDSLVYLVGSRDNIWDYATVYIKVYPINSPIIVRDDAAKTNVNTTIEISILDNDYDEDNGIDSASVILTTPINGTAIYDRSTGTVSYTPNTDVTGTDVFSYRLCDLDLEDTSCDSATVTILVRSENETLNAKNDDYKTDEDTPLALIDPLPTDNDEVLNGSIDMGSFIIVTSPHHGSHSIDTDKVVTYSPAHNYFGPDWMTYQVSDTNGSTDMAEINLWVNEVNDAPIAVNDTFVVTKNTEKRLYLLSNDFDPDGTLNFATLDTLTGKGPRKGSIKFDRSTGTLLYSPLINADFDKFTYTICDDRGLCSEAIVIVRVDLGSTILYTQITDEDTPNTYDLAPLLASYNFFDNVIKVDEVVESEIGTWEIVNNNTQITYTPDHDSTGFDYYNLTLYLANGDTVDLQVNVIINPINDAPVAINDTIIWTDSTKSVTVSYDFILLNDYDVDGDSIFLTEAVIEQGDPNMVITFNTDSTITLTSDTILWCKAWFTYQIKDTALSAIGLVTLLPTLDGIVANTDSFSVDENGGIVLLDVTDNDKVKDNQECTIYEIQLITPPKNGIAESTDDPAINYRPTDQYYGPDSLQYLLIDIWGQSDSAWVYIEVTQLNTPPIAWPDDPPQIELGESQIVCVLDNDYDPDPDGYIDTTATYMNVDARYGTVVFDTVSGCFIYTPLAFTCEDDQFSYIIFDNEHGTDTAIVTINFPDEAEINAVTDTVHTYPGIPIDFNVLANDQGFFYPVVEYYQQPYFGSVSQTGDSTFTFYPNADFMGRDSMTYQLVSPCGNQTTGYVIFLIEELKVPQIITPNNDDSNDLLIIDGIEYFPDAFLQIFNRYGHVVYQSKGYKNNWEGHSNQGSFGGDKPLPNGTYFYTLTYNEGRNRQAGIIYINR